MANTNTLKSRAMLVAVNQRAWKGRAADREVAAKAELEANAEQGTMTVIKELAPKNMIFNVQHALTVGRQEHYRLTTPGLFRGQHLLATALFEEYMLLQAECRDQFWRRVNEFLAIYPQIVERAKVKLGSSFKASDFPDESRIKTYFGYEVVCGPIPDITDWRLEGLEDKDVSTLRGEVEDGIRSMYNQNTRILFERARKMLESFVSQAKNYDPVSAPGAMLRDATLDNMRELAELVSAMNVTGDPVLDQVSRTMLKEFADLEGKELRKSAELRGNAAKMAQTILAKMVPAKKRAA